MAGLPSPRIGSLAVPLSARISVSSHRGDDARYGVHPANALVEGVGDVEVAAAVDGDSLGRIELGRGGRDVIPGVPCRGVAGHRGDDSGPGSPCG